MKRRSRPRGSTKKLQKQENSELAKKQSSEEMDGKIRKPSSTIRNDANIKQALNDGGGPSNSTMCTLLEQFEKLSAILGAKCFDVVGRMKLDYTPFCVQDMVFCSTHHSKKCPRPSVVDMYQSSTAKHLLYERRALHFLKFVEDMCIRTEFPGEDIIFRLWELILTVNPSEEDKYSSKYVIQECILLFEKILFIFPPCWYDIRDSYVKLLTKSIDLTNILPNSNASQQTILEFVISTLSEVIVTEDKESVKSTTDNTDGNFFNYHEWEEQNVPRHNFEVLSRTEKIDRLFVILHLISKLMELDLSIWILRNISKPSEHIYGARKPLVSAVFKFDSYTQIKDLAKDTLKLFVCCTCFSYPVNQINFISRLVSLLSVAINLCEKPKTKKIDYPNIGPITEAFAKEIFKTVDSYVGRSVSHYLSVIEHIKIPFIKYLVIDQLLFKMNRDPGQMSAKKIVENFRNGRWQQCSDENRIVEPRGSCKYPVVPKKFPKPKVTDIYRQEYLDILLEALKAYCDVFAIKEVALLFNPKKVSSSEVVDKKQFQPKIGNSEKLRLSLIERDITKLVSEVNMKQKRYPLDSGISELDGIHVDDNVMMQYREEIKYSAILHKNIPIFREEYGSTFDKWYNFIQNELFEVN